MPLYEFICAKCGRQFEELASDAESVKCPACGASDTQKLISACCRHTRGNDSGPAPVASSGCGGCSGGNCASCGR